MAEAVCSAWRDSHLPGLEKPLAVLNLELKTSSPLAPERKKKEECFCAWKGWLVPREESCPGCLGGKAEGSEGQEFILEKQVSRFSSAAQDVLHLLLLLQPPPLLCLSCQGAPSPPGGPVPSPPGGPVPTPGAQCHCVPVGSKAPGTGG